MGKAQVDSYQPFTIKLCIATGESKQNLILGVDAGYAHVGFSVVGPTKEVFSGEIKLLQGQVERNDQRRMYRRQRRSRLRYRNHKKKGSLFGWEP